MAGGKVARVWITIFRFYAFFSIFGHNGGLKLTPRRSLAALVPTLARSSEYNI